MIERSRLPELFEELAVCSPAEREARLAEIRRADAAVAEELASLLVAATGRETVLDAPAWERFGGATERAPASAGPFRLLREIGRGGMGRVFLAEQEGEGFRRQVAIKLLDDADPSPHRLARFLAERRILASLEHPGIARFLDAGRTEDGSLYLALELVEGEDLFSFCRQRRLSLAERLRLFLELLAAVRYAHAQLVVHRDLKPANILVDGSGRPRLLDFGISKLLDEENDATRTRAERALTPAYASPEQLRGEPVGVGTDVFSLGVVLYELISGRRPFAAAEGTTAGLERAILESEAEPPNTSSAEWAERGFPFADLDAIVLKALRKEPEQRYLSVEAFADDLERLLDGREVRARRGGRRYRWGKLLRRHRTAFAVAAVGLVAVLSALGVALWQRHAALAARERAERRFHDLQDLSRTLLFEVHDAVQGLPDAAPVSKLIVERALSYLESLEAEAQDDLPLLEDLAAGYERIAFVLAVPPGFVTTLADPPRGLAYFERTLTLRRQIVAARPADETSRLRLGETLLTYGEALRMSRRIADSRSAFREAEEIFAALDAGHPERLDLACLRGRVAASQLRLEQNVDRRAPAASAALAAARTIWGPILAHRVEDLVGQRKIGLAAANYAQGLVTAGFAEEANRPAEVAVAVLEKTPPPRPDRLYSTALALAYEMRAQWLQAAGRTRDALDAIAGASTIHIAWMADPKARLGHSIQLFGDLQQQVDLALAVPDLPRAAAALAEMDRLLAGPDYQGPHGRSARAYFEKLASDLAFATAAQSTNVDEADRQRAAGRAAAERALAIVAELGGGKLYPELAELERVLHARLRGPAPRR